MKVGSKVEKTAGYKWPGVIVASFKTLAGQRRYVVECTVPEVEGALHIYSPSQLRTLVDPDALELPFNTEKKL